MKSFFYIYCEPKNGAHGGPDYRGERFQLKADAEALVEELNGTVGQYWRLSVQEHETLPRGWAPPAEWEF